jgi:hypothetical protein
VAEISVARKFGFRPLTRTQNEPALVVMTPANMTVFQLPLTSRNYPIVAHPPDFIIEFEILEDAADIGGNIVEVGRTRS